MSLNNNIQDKNYIPLTPFKGWVIENFPFIEADFDAITNYQLLCKVTEYLNNVISNQNQVQELGNELVNDFNSLLNEYNNLFNYVNNYFENLNVQEEINNKLDELVEDGTLSLLLSQFTNYVTPDLFGCVGDGVTDDTNNFQDALDYIGQNHKTLYINKLYLVNNLKLNAYDDGYIYTIKGEINKQKGTSNINLKNGLITNSNVFNTDELSSTSIQIHFYNLNANVKNKNITYSSFIYKCHIERSNITDCNITGFDYCIYGSCNVNTIIENNNFKNVGKAFLKVFEGSGYGFYDSIIQNNYINAYHSGTDFHGIPSKRTSFLIDTERTGFGVDGRIINNFIDYFTYFIDRDLVFELSNNTPPTYSSKNAGLVTGNVFQNMLNMIGLGINLQGQFINNLFDGFCKDTIYSYLDNTNCGPFSIATYECEINNTGTNVETSFPYRKFEIINISNNVFNNLSKAIYFDFNYSLYPSISATTLTSSHCIIENNRTSSTPAFEEICTYSPQYNDNMFLYNRIQTWDYINKPDTAMNDFKVLHDHKIFAHQGSIGRFSDGLYIAYYSGVRSYYWIKIADIT